MERLRVLGSSFAQRRRSEGLEQGSNLAAMTHASKPRRLQNAFKATVLRSKDCTQ